MNNEIFLNLLLVLFHWAMGNIFMEKNMINDFQSVRYIKVDQPKIDQHCGGTHLCFHNTIEIKCRILRTAQYI